MSYDSFIYLFIYNESYDSLLIVCLRYTKLEELWIINRVTLFLVPKIDEYGTEAHARTELNIFFRVEVVCWWGQIFYTKKVYVFPF